VVSAAGAVHQNIAQVAGATVVTGNGVAAGSLRVALPTDGTGVVGLIAGSAIIGKVGLDQTTDGTTNGVSVVSTTIDDYETVAASQTAQVLGATGATGDFINHLLVVPATLNPGAISVLDNATSITVFTGGTASVSSLAPFTIYLRMKSVSGAWKVTTGAAVSVIGVGKFT
jgi:hypothetical protein